MRKSEHVVARMRPELRAWSRLAATLARQSESQFIREAITEKILRQLAALPTETVAPPADDPEFAAKTHNNRAPAPRGLPRLQAAHVARELRKAQS